MTTSEMVAAPDKLDGDVLALARELAKAKVGGWTDNGGGKKSGMMLEESESKP